MNGNRYLLDTNAIIQLLKGNSEIAGILKNAKYIACSVISVIEFLSFSNLEAEDKSLF
jgi:tRNA(fMet)-specific endonuclease VapC